jgi:DNA-binding XRE family transcriptional regulator
MVQIPRLREWREARALTQVELAELADVSPRSVAGYEAGGGARPPTVRRLAEALDVEIADLREDPGSPKKAEAQPSQRSLFNGFEEERRSPLSPWAEHVRRIADGIRHHTGDPKSHAFRDLYAAQFFVEEKDAEAAGLYSALFEKEGPYDHEPIDVWEEPLSAFEESELDRRRRRAAEAEAKREQTSPRIAAHPESRGA